MSKKIKQIALYDNDKWQTPIGFEVNAQDVSLDIIDEYNNHVIRSIEEIIGDYTNSKSISDRLKEMRGAASSMAGVSGLIPAAPPDDNKIIYSDGTWKEYIETNFCGTLVDWNNLTISEKILYDTVDLVRGYKIIYNANNGAGNIPIDEVPVNESYEIKNGADYLTPPLGKQFKEWNTLQDGAGDSYQAGDRIIIKKPLILYAIWEDKQIIALKFSSDEPFTLSVSNPGWDGTLEYSINKGKNWNTWDGSQLSGTNEQPIYLRGIGNTVITGGGDIWNFTGKYCTGNIETLLDYHTIMNGQHPTMGTQCYAYMFYNRTSLIIPPELPATTLAYGCYQDMFYDCTSLEIAPELPATILASNCYKDMFCNCTSLTTAPELPATTLNEQCYYSMFSGCTSLTTLPELPAIKLEAYCYNAIFYGCTSLKLSTIQTDIYQYPYRIPTSGTGITATSALSNMFSNTGGTFTGTPAINTIYYTDHEPI